MKQLTLDVEGLSEDQIVLVRNLILKMKQAKDREASLTELREFLWQGVTRDNVFSEDEALEMTEQLISRVRKQ